MIFSLLLVYIKHQSYETSMINKSQTSMNTFANATPRSPEGAAQRSIKWACNPSMQRIEPVEIGLRGSAMGKEIV